MPPLDPNRNLLWARALAEELARSGVRHACVSPGNRSGPLAFALAAQPLKVWSHIDERSGGYFALGLAKATRAPVAVACTSGTAAANLLPAVVEAWHARVPLVVLTADRPPDLRDVGANQAIHQAGLFGAHARWAADLPLPQAEDRALRHLRALAGRAVAVARGPPAGPVHLNVPFAKPLEPTAVPGEIPPAFAEEHPLAFAGRADGGPFVRVAPAGPAPPPPGALEAARAPLRRTRGLLVAGPTDDPGLPDAVARFASRTGWPVLADPLAGLRFGPHAGSVLGAYDAALEAVPSVPAPEVVVRVGAPPTSDALLRWLEAAHVDQLVLDGEADWREPLHLPGLRIPADPPLALGALAPLAAPPDPAWSALWRRLEDAVRAAARPALDAFTEAACLLEALDLAPEGATVVVGNSLPVRDLDRFGAPRAKPLRVLANRGASGIDGVTSTALGAAAAGERVLLVTGDLSFYHDLPGLLAVKRLGVEATMVVLHNDGGRLFEQLPAARHDPPFRDLFLTPHGLDFEPAARMFGARFARADDRKGFREHLAAGLGERGASVLEARIDPAASRAARDRCRELVAEGVRAALRGPALAR